MIGAYRDCNGYVGEAPRLSDHAEDVQDAARDVSRRLSDMLREIEDLIDEADRSAQDVDEDPAGYRRSHAQHWAATVAQLVVAEDAMHAFSKMVRAA